MKDYIIKSLAEYFGMDEHAVPEPLTIQYANWDSTDKQTGTDALYFYPAGQPFWDVAANMTQPWGPDEQIHVVGSAYSLHQGWGEGALRTAEFTLLEHMRVPRWTRLSREEYCELWPFHNVVSLETI